MKIFGVQLGKQKPMGFPEFREMLRRSILQAQPASRVVITENGFALTQDGRTQTCNLRGVYAAYARNPEHREKLMNEYLDSLDPTPPAHAWMDAISLLRPSLRSAAFLTAAHKSLQKQNPPDTLPSEPFVGDLHAIAMTEFRGRIWAVTQGLLDNWGVEMRQVMEESLRNMGMRPFPPITGVMQTGGGKLGPVKEMGLVFEGDHLTASWLLSDRFRDYVIQRMQCSLVVAVPNRSKLTIVREDQPGLISTLNIAGRSYASLPYPLTPQLYYIDARVTGGSVSLYRPAGQQSDVLGSDSVFAPGAVSSPTSLTQAMEMERFSGLTELADLWVDEENK